MLGSWAVINLGFIAFLLDYRRHQFAWFTAMGNIAAVIAMSGVLIATLAWALRARRLDHIEDYGVWLARMRRIVKTMWIVGIAMPVLVTATLLQKLLLPDLYDFVAASVYMQATAVCLRWLLSTPRPVNTQEAPCTPQRSSFS